MSFKNSENENRIISMNKYKKIEITRTIIYHCKSIKLQQIVITVLGCFFFFFFLFMFVFIVGFKLFLTCSRVPAFISRWNFFDFSVFTYQIEVKKKPSDLKGQKKELSRNYRSFFWVFLYSSLRSFTPFVLFMYKWMRERKEKHRKFPWFTKNLRNYSKNFNQSKTQQKEIKNADRFK